MTNTVASYTSQVILLLITTTGRNVFCSCLSISHLPLLLLDFGISLANREILVYFLPQPTPMLP